MPKADHRLRLSASCSPSTRDQFGATGPVLQIIGSGNLIQDLQAASLIDEYNVWMFPVLLGRGKRLFESAAKAQFLRLISSKASGTGVLLNTYEPAGETPLGSFVPAQSSAKEIERRERMTQEAL